LLGLGELWRTLLQPRVESHLEQVLVGLVAEDEVDEEREGGPELLGVGGLELDGDARLVAVGWGWHEEPADGELEGAGEGDDLVGVEVADELAGDGAFGLGDAGFGPALADVGLECLGGLVLGPALP
jgi:hypothetical protein